MHANLCLCLEDKHPNIIAHLDLCVEVFFQIDMTQHQSVYRKRITTTTHNIIIILPSYHPFFQFVCATTSGHSNFFNLFSLCLSKPLLIYQHPLRQHGHAPGRSGVSFFSHPSILCNSSIWVSLCGPSPRLVSGRAWGRNLANRRSLSEAMLARRSSSTCTPHTTPTEVKVHYLSLRDSVHYKSRYAEQSGCMVSEVILVALAIREECARASFYWHKRTLEQEQKVTRVLTGVDGSW